MTDIFVDRNFPCCKGIGKNHFKEVDTYLAFSWEQKGTTLLDHVDPYQTLQDSLYSYILLRFCFTLLQQLNKITIPGLWAFETIKMSLFSFHLPTMRSLLDLKAILPLSSYLANTFSELLVLPFLFSLLFLTFPFSQSSSYISWFRRKIIC